MATIVKNLGNYFQMGEALAANDAVYISGVDGKIYKFDVTDNTQVFAGFAKEAGVLDDWTFVSQSGSIKGFTGLTPGAFVYASTTVPGGFQLLDPGPSQKIVFGIARSATELTINGGLGIKPGGDGGGGGLDAYYIENMEGLNDTSDFAVGNNATFLGGGTLQGSLVIDDVAPISGLKSLKYTQAAGSLNDYFASDIIDIDLKQQNNDSGMKLYFEYDGNDNDMRFVVWDVTNNQRLSSEASFVKLTGKAQRYSLSFYVPTSCTQIRWGAQVLVENASAILVVDDVEMSTDPFMEGELTNMTDWQDFTPTGTWTVNTAYSGRWRRVGDSMEIRTIAATNGAPSPAGNFIFNIPSGYVIDSSKVSTTLAAAPLGTAMLRGAGAFRPASVTYSNTSSVVLTSLSDASATNHTQTAVSSTFPFAFASGDLIQAEFRVPILGWTSSTPHVLTPTDTFSTDTAPLNWASPAQYDSATLANAPIGTYITFQYAANSNARTQCATRPTQADADMNVNGMQIFTRAYNANSTAAQPAVIAIQIGKGMKGWSTQLTANPGSGLLFQDVFVVPPNREAGLTRGYIAETGVLYLDAGVNHSGTVTTKYFEGGSDSAYTSGYLVINASKSAALTAVPTPLVAYLKDVKPSGTVGGTFTAGAWQTRTLNTIEGDTSFVTLSANQFTLPAGRYEIEASAPAYKVNDHKSKIRNITNSSDVILGGSGFSNSSEENTVSYNLIVGEFTISIASTFELQHRCNITGVTTGFGAAGSFGVNETYSIVKIKKVG